MESATKWGSCRNYFIASLSLLNSNHHHETDQALSMGSGHTYMVDSHLGLPPYPDLPMSSLVLALKVLYPRNSLDLGKLGEVGHLKLQSQALEKRKTITALY